MSDPFGDALREWEERKKKLLQGPYEHIDYRRLSRTPEPPEPEPLIGEPEIDEPFWYSHAFLLAQPGAGKPTSSAGVSSSSSTGSESVKLRSSCSTRKAC